MDAATDAETMDGDKGDDGDDGDDGEDVASVICLEDGEEKK